MNYQYVAFQSLTTLLIKTSCPIEGVKEVPLKAPDFIKVDDNTGPSVPI